MKPRSIFLLTASLLLSACATVSERAAERVVAAVDAKVASDAPSVAGTTPNVAPDASNVPLRTTIVSHLANAADIAKAAGDAPGVQCWTTLGRWVETLPLAKADAAPDPVLPDATGPAGRAELVRIKAKLAEQRINAVKTRVAALRTAIDAGVPDDVVTACAVVVHDARSIVLRVLSMIGLAGL